MNALEIRDLSKEYPHFCLDHLNLTLPGGCIMGLVGENGAGKSTTIKLILDMIQADTGTITILGRENKSDIRSLKEEIGVVLDEVGLPECLKAGQIGRVMRNIFKSWDDAAYEDYLHRLSIPADRKFKEFSRGMKMKLGIAVALSHHPRLLILDEATNGLDPVVRDEVVEMFGEFTRDEDHSILISSHIVSDLEKLCDYIAFLHQGRLLLYEEKDALREQYGILRCTAEQLRELEPSAVLGKKESPYGVEAMVRRDAVPAGFTLGTASIEELFIFMIKGDRHEPAPSRKERNNA